MSLKAKIEAVIYASEEPVTLAQLIGLLSEEAQGELDAMAAQQTELALENDAPAGDADALNDEVLGPEAAVGEASDGDAADSKVAESEQGAAGGSDAGADTMAESTPEEETPAPAAAANAADDEASAKAEARAKERALKNHLRAQVEALVGEYANADRGIEIREVAGGYRFATKAEYHDAVRGFIKSLKPPLKLSLQALETLAVIAYKQPVTGPEIGEIRGVDSGGVLASLMARKLITTAGRKQVIGRPILYKTTKEFLVRFGLKDINELPSIEEFEKMAGELEDMEPMQEEIPMEREAGNELEDNGGAERMDASGGSAPLDELNSAPEPTTTRHESVEDVLSDNSSQPEGHLHEPATSLEEAESVEPMAKEHEAQADGDSEDVTDDTERAGAEPAADIADEAIVDGRIAGLDPDYSKDEDENPSAMEAELQNDEKTGGE
jgi:segregation and condensation protein B